MAITKFKYPVTNSVIHGIKVKCVLHINQMTFFYWQDQELFNKYDTSIFGSLAMPCIFPQKNLLCIYRHAHTHTVSQPFLLYPHFFRSFSTKNQGLWDIFSPLCGKKRRSSVHMRLFILYTVDEGESEP